ncbi:MAG: UDP-N-acetylmuramate--alanine ligase [Chloroflexota bacterium]|jgi:UDP-N-acetylmuramate--alanine ligase|nr:UDP-N-acetylmuramate--alanine ligase [Chloroflexota bacterium]
MTRAAAEIGRGLAPARAARPIRPGERIHVLGAAGAGASAAALLAHRAGAVVSGCDQGGPSPYSAALLEAGIAIDWQHDPAHVERPADQRPERLAVTKALTAVNPDHPELAAAHRLGIPTEPWQQVVADAAASSGQRLVAVAGTHGKSTTAGWLVDVLVRAERDPSAFVGALLDASLTGETPSTARWGSGDVFVVEADEYAGNFDPYRPSLILLLNAEWDHPDVFADADAVYDAFAGWIRAAGKATLVANIADDGVQHVVERLSGWDGRIVTVGLDVPTADVYGQAEVDEGKTTLVVNGRLGSGVYNIGLPGRHNAANGLVVLAAAKILAAGGHGAPDLGGFRGVGRRLELKGEVGDVVVLDDYGHHPTAIAKTIEAVRERYPNRRLWAVYEPLTFHRTAAMLERFADVLATADEVAIADIWAGRDPDTTITSATALADAVNRLKGPRATAPGSVEQTADYVATKVKSGEVVLVMGGGRSYVIAERLVGLLRQ